MVHSVFLTPPTATPLRPRGLLYPGELSASRFSGGLAGAQSVPGSQPQPPPPEQQGRVSQWRSGREDQTLVQLRGRFCHLRAFPLTSSRRSCVCLPVLAFPQGGSGGIEKPSHR